MRRIDHIYVGATLKGRRHVPQLRTRQDQAQVTRAGREPGRPSGTERPVATIRDAVSRPSSSRSAIGRDTVQYHAKPSSRRSRQENSLPTAKPARRPRSSTRSRYANVPRRHGVPYSSTPASSTRRPSSAAALDGRLRGAGYRSRCSPAALGGGGRRHDASSPPSPARGCLCGGDTTPPRRRRRREGRDQPGVPAHPSAYRDGRHAARSFGGLTTA